MVTIGIRIEFYESLSPAPHTYRGALVTEQTFTAEVVPRVGERLAVTSLQAGRGPNDPLVIHGEGMPFLVVTAVEHYPKPVAEGDTPSVVVVAPCRVGPLDDPTEREGFVQALRRYANSGWHVMVHDDPSRLNQAEQPV